MHFLLSALLLFLSVPLTAQVISAVRMKISAISPVPTLSPRNSAAPAVQLRMRRRGTINAEHPATPDEETAEIQRVWKQSYAGLPAIAHSVDETAMLAYGVSSTPTLALIDRKGIVRLYCPFRLSESALARNIEPLL